jgi:hypothetical protein
LVDLSLSSVSNATGNFLTISGGVVHQRTPSETRSDVGAQAQLNGTGFVKASGTTITYDNSTYQVTSEKAQPNGYASLDSNGKVPLVQINDALIGNVNFQGLWNAATNTPTLANPPASGTKGYYYIVSTAGTFAGISFEVGDWIISNGTAWGKVDNTDAVSSVFGRTGNVVAANGDYNTSQVNELTNLYYTEARVNANANVAANTAARHNAVTLGTANGLSLSTQVLSLQLATSGQNGALSSTDWTTFNSKENAITAGTTAQYFRGDKTFQTLNTGAVPESGNLYFTNARAIASVLTGYTSGAGTISAADSILSAIQKLNGNIGALVTGVSSVNGQTGVVVLTTTNIAEGTNLYYTEARVNANTNVAANTAARHAAVTLGTANGLSLSTQQLSLGLASAGVTGALSGTDWSTFNSKQQALNGTGFVKISGTTISYDNTSYLPLTGGTLTGALSGTSASFSGNVSLNTSLNFGSVTVGNSIFTTDSKFQHIRISVESDLAIIRTDWFSGAGGAQRDLSLQYGLQERVRLNSTGISVTGQATFSSSVIATSFELGNGQFFRARRNFNNALINVLGFESGTDDLVQVFSNTWKLRGTGGAGDEKITITSTGVATFSSTITATQFIRSGGTSSQFLKADGSVDSNSYYLASNPSAFIALTALSGTAPIQYNNTTGAISITQASGSTNGFLSSTDWNTFNNKTSNVGTVTSVAALTLGTTGTDLSSTVANGTTTPVITLNVPTASAANRGALSAADWTTFNGKQDNIVAGTTAQYYRGDKTFQTLNTAAVPELTNLYYTEARVSANTDVAANTAARHAAVTLGTANGLSLSTQQLSLGLASSSANGALSSTDWTTFNNKQNALTNPVTGTGTSGQVAYFNGTSSITGEANLFWDATNDRLGIGTATPATRLHIANSSSAVLFAQDGTTATIVGADAAGSSSQGLFLRGFPLTFTGNGGGSAAQMTLNSSGNLGLGVTPSAWGSLNTGTLQLQNGSLYRFSNTSFGLVNNGFYNGTNWIYSSNGLVADYYQETGQHIWRTAPSGTAGNAISFTQAMTLGSNSGLSIGTPSAAPSQGLLVQGNVGIGTSPSVKLDVNGKIFSSTEVQANNAIINTTGAYATFGSNSSAVGVRVGRDAFFDDIIINTGGNVSIGTTSDPGFKLNVAGTGRFSGNVLLNTSLNFGSVTVGNSIFTTDSKFQHIRISVESDLAIIRTDWFSGAGGAQRDLSLQYGLQERIRLNSTGISVTGQATFSSSVFASSFTSQGGRGTSFGFRLPDWQIYNTSSGNGFAINNYSNDVLTLASTGAATFSSSVTAASFIVNTSGQARTITTFYPSGSLGDNIWIGGGGLNSTTGGGSSALASLNTSLGVLALQNNTTGYRNTSVGYSSLRDNTTGYSNTSVGEFSLWKNTTGYINSAFGSSSLNSNTTGYANSALGTNSLGYITTGRENVAVGFWAGFLINSGGNNTTSSNSTYLGQDTRASADGNTNEVVIGSGARGQGSNSVVIGNGSITKTILRGDVLIGTETPATGAMLNVNGSIRTAAPTGTSTENWRLGRALLATSSDPEDRWIRVQLGTKIYDILAIDRGDA